MYSLMGPSGSGKSTLLNLLSLIDRPTSGSILIENKTINFNNVSENDFLRAKKIGIIYQQDNLLPDFTSLENISLASLASGLDKKTSTLKAKNLLNKIGLSNRSDHYPSQLSGGEKQRVSIARALINEPDIILADEPTGNLDTVSGKAVEDLLFELQSSSNSTLVIVTHDRELASRCSRIVEIRNGIIE